MALEVFVKCLSKVPQTVSGDAFWYAESGPRLWALVVDGLGSGVPAAEAARRAVGCVTEAIERLSGTSFEPRMAMHDMVTDTDRVLRRTRGAALGLAFFDAQRREGHFLGVGNIEMRVMGCSACVRPVATPGIVGGGLHRLRVETFSYTPSSLIVMHSDGLSSRFELSSPIEPSLSLREIGEGLVAAHAKNDDLTLLMVKQHA